MYYFSFPGNMTEIPNLLGQKNKSVFHSIWIGDKIIVCTPNCSHDFGQSKNLFSYHVNCGTNTDHGFFWTFSLYMHITAINCLKAFCWFGRDASYVPFSWVVLMSSLLLIILFQRKRSSDDPGNDAGTGMVNFYIQVKIS